MEISKLTAMMLEGISIPPQPETLVQFLAKSKSKDCDIKDITEILNKDMALVASILRTVNSVAFGLEYNVTSVQQAIMLMGLKNLGNLVYCFCMRQALYNGDEGLGEFWEQSNQLSMIATNLANRYTQIEPDEVFTSSLLANCGVPSLTEHRPEYLKGYMGHAFNKDVSITKYEDTLYHLDHSVVGYYLAKKWNLPECIYHCIYFHHSTDFENDFSVIKDEDLKGKIKTIILVLQLSEYIYTRIYSLNEPFSWTQNYKQILADLIISNQDIETFIKEMYLLKN